MEKYMLELELRYRKVVGDEDRYATPQIVIGIYDTWEEAEVKGNEIISQCLSKHFDVRGGDKFTKNYCYGIPNNLVTNTCYHKGKPEYFFRIRKLNMTDDVETFVTNAINEYNQYLQWQQNNW